MKSSKERSRSKKSGYAVAESIMPSLIARAPAVRVEKHNNELGERFIDTDCGNIASLPCFWKEEREEIRDEEAVKLASRNQMRASARKDFFRTHKPGVQMGDDVPATGKHDRRLMYDFKESAEVSDCTGIQPSSAHIPLSNDVIKGKKQVKFKPTAESKPVHNNNMVASDQTHEVPENLRKKEDNFMETENRSQRSGFLNSNTCSWKKQYDPSEYKEGSNLFEKHVDSSEIVDSTNFQWSKEYDPLQFEDMEEPDSVRSVPPLAIGSDAEG